MTVESSFSPQFRALTGNEPMPWQEAVFGSFCAGDFSRPLSLPTGLGKTSVVHLWLLALSAAPERVPRRLVYVVNRRTVVDQATREAEKVREVLATPDAGSADPKVIATRRQLRDSLLSLCAKPVDVPLAISTLRGQFADNGEWVVDPCRPAIILGTVDMIGSRLLFSAYGRGFRTQPRHAGLLGQDVLLVHDEAHLEPAFQHLIDGIRALQVSRFS
jgi:CRISPR-associated endonuclease/helicase Cas3